MAYSALRTQHSGLRIGTLQWAIGVYCMLMGALMLLAPHQFDAPAYAVLRSHLPWWGTTFLLAGIALVSVNALAPRGMGDPPSRPYVVAAHILAGTALLLLASGFAITYAWSGTALFATLGLATGLAPLLARAEERHPVSEGDLFALVMGAGSVLTGLIILVVPIRYGSPTFESVRPSVVLYGAALLGGGLSMAVAQLRPSLRRAASWALHLPLAGTLLVYLAAVELPLSRWTGIAFYGGFGVTLALLPWLGPRLRRLDRASLRTRLALTLAAAAALPLVVVVAVHTEREEHEVTAQALAQQQTLAAALAQDVADYVGLHRAAVAALAAQPGLLDLAPEAQRTLLQAINQAYPDVVAFSTYDDFGNPLARSDDRLPLHGTDFRAFEDARRTGEPSLDILFGPLVQRPVFAFGAPVLTPGGRFGGLVLAAFESDRLAALLARTSPGAGSETYLVDGRGRVIAHRDVALVAAFADLSPTPPVAALLARGGASGSLGYSTPAGEWLAGYAVVPQLGWGVVVERPSAAALANLNATHNLAFWLLLLVIGAAAALGAFIAGRLVAPLGALARAVDQLASAEATAPLPKSRVTEVGHLATVLGEMRERLTARTAERDRAEEQLRARARQQAAVAELGHRALAGTGVAPLLSEAVALVARTLDLEPTRVLQLLSDGPALLLHARAPLPSQDRAQPSGARPAERRAVTQDDTYFLQAIADVLATAMERKRIEEERAHLLVREQAARAQAERLAAERAASLGQIADGVVIADPSGRITFINQAACRLLCAIEPGSLLEACVPITPLLTASEQPYQPEEFPLARAARRGETVVNAEVRIRRPDGREVVAQGSAAPVVAEDGTRLGAVMTLHDVTA
ncbi:MAG: PAS domain-containing protein, partial [Chloroflexi bacterium]|nr:PAS domain-containing protein [Chloroflexota bacterium]